MEEITFKITDNDREWDGKLKINEIQENQCIAKLESRGSAFDVVLNCYFDKYNIQEWCVTVPDWDFGFKANRLEEYLNEEKIEKYIPNKIDRKSLACGITEMFKAVGQYRELKLEQDRTENKANPEEKENIIDNFIKESITKSALSTLDSIREGHNIQHTRWEEERFSSYIDTFLAPENGINEKKYEDSLKEIKTGLKRVFTNISINFPYDKEKFNKMCDNAEEEILRITDRNKQDMKKKTEQVMEAQEKEHRKPEIRRAVGRAR